MRCEKNVALGEPHSFLYRSVVLFDPFNNDNWASGDLRMSDRRISPGTISVSARLNGRSIDAMVNFKFENPGSGFPLRPLDWEFLDNIPSGESM
jgi:hypothetical protein